MEGIPLCCQQRPVPRTRRWQGVPFFVRAPQIETTSYMEQIYFRTVCVHDSTLFTYKQGSLNEVLIDSQ